MISADFLAALPNGIQHEMLEQHRFDRTRQCGLLDVPAGDGAASTMRRNERPVLADSSSRGDAM